ncbi:hypothetical protein V8F20_010876 [Naviculisporaceae sp. PSN 640]
MRVSNSRPVVRPYGAGRDIWSITPEDVDQLLKLFYISTFFYLGSRCLIRVSIICFLLRLFEISGSKRLLQACLVFNITLSTSFGFALAFQCSPPSYFWHGWDHMHQGTCVDQWAMLLAAGILAIMFDVFLIDLPLVWIARLQFSLAKKLVTGLMMSLGVVSTDSRARNNRVVAVSVMRILVLRKFLTEPNITANFPIVTIWGGLDIHVALICACMPRLRLVSSWVITKVVPESFRSRSSSKGRKSTNPPTIGSGGKRKVLRTIGWSTYPDTGNESAHAIKMTTTIQQQNDDSRSESQTQLSLHSLELYDRQNGNVRGQAWA